MIDQLPLEGISMEGDFRPKPTPSTSKLPPGAANHNNSEEMDDEDVNIDDLPERLSDTAGLGNMPELTLLLEDDEVIDKFDDPTTAKYLREISLDPSCIESLKSKPEIQFMLRKIEEMKVEVQRRQQQQK